MLIRMNPLLLFSFDKKIMYGKKCLAFSWKLDFGNFYKKQLNSRH